jgi:hypothetical protein
MDIILYIPYTVKRLAIFESPVGMSLTKLSRAESFPAQQGEFGDIPAGDGKTANLFLQCILRLRRMSTYPDKDEDLGVSDAVLALRHPDHWELGRTLALRHQVPHLGTKSFWSHLWQKMPYK